MPKFPLFENRIPEEKDIVFFWLIHRYPTCGQNRYFLDDLAELRANPHQRMSHRLVSLVLALRLTGSGSLEMMITGNSRPEAMTPKGRLAILQINQWLLAHDDAAMKFTTDLPDSAFTSTLDWLAELGNPT